MSLVYRISLYNKWKPLPKNNSKRSFHKLVKDDHAFEKYFVSLLKCYLVPILTLRSGGHKLPVAKGRFSNIVRKRRYCDLCDGNMLGDEYHFYFSAKTLHWCNTETVIYLTIIELDRVYSSVLHC